MIKKLPSVRRPSNPLKLVKPIQINPKLFNNSSYVDKNSYISQKDQFNQTLMQSQLEY